MCEEKTFDELVKLHQTDPEAFEEYRKTHILNELTKMCAGCPDCLNRCQRFQWRLEQELNKYKDPIARYNKMVELFWKQTEEFQQTLSGQKPKPKIDNPASIIQFPGKE